MRDFTPDRRSLLKGGAVTMAAAATMSADQLLNYATAWAQTAQWKPEAGARINLLRWKRFVEAEDVAFMKMVDAFQRRPERQSPSPTNRLTIFSPSIRCRQHRQGLDMVWGLYSLPHLLPTKVVDVADVANYLGGKYGGWTQVGRRLLQGRR